MMKELKLHKMENNLSELWNVSIMISNSGFCEQ